MTFNPSSLMYLTCFLRASPAEMMAGGTQALKSFITTTVFTDDLPWLLPRKESGSRPEESMEPCPCAFHSGIPHGHGQLEPGPPSSHLWVNGKLALHCSGQDTPAPPALAGPWTRQTGGAPLTPQQQSTSLSVCAHEKRHENALERYQGPQTN